MGSWVEASAGGIPPAADSEDLELMPWYREAELLLVGAVALCCFCSTVCSTRAVEDASRMVRLRELSRRS